MPASSARVYEVRTTDSFYNDFDPATMGWRASAQTSGGGELIDTGYHPTYLLLHLAGGMPVEATAMLSTHRLTFMEGEDSAQVLVRFDNGVVGQMVTSWAYDAGARHGALLRGRRAAARCTASARESLTRDAARWHDAGVGLRPGRHVRRGDRPLRRLAHRRHAAASTPRSRASPPSGSSSPPTRARRQDDRPGHRGRVLTRRSPGEVPGLRSTVPDARVSRRWPPRVRRGDPRARAHRRPSATARRSPGR